MTVQSLFNDDSIEKRLIEIWLHESPSPGDEP